MIKLCCLRKRQGDDVESKEEEVVGATATRDEQNTPVSPDNKRSSMYYFSAIQSESDFENLSREEQENMAKTIFLSTREQLVSDNTTRFQYAPARVPDPHPPKSILMDVPETLKTNKESGKSTKIIREALTQADEGTPHLAGYPGELSETEIKSCLEFRARLKQPNYQTHREIVHVYSTVEEEPYALCRCLRARQFDPDQTLDMIGSHADCFLQGKGADFYKDIDAALGCPVTVFLSQFPFVFSGISRNGCPVVYFLAERFSIEGMDCLVKPEERLIFYVWYALTTAVKMQVERAKSENRNARCELLVVVNLKGLAASTINSRTLALLKGIMPAVDCFPEVLNRIVIINAPYFFSYSWVIIRKFLDPRTAAKVEIDSGTSKKRLEELVDPKGLLRNFGGVGSDFDRVLMEQGNSDASRQTVKLLYLKPGEKSKVDFALSRDEQASVFIHCKSKAEAVLEVGPAGAVKRVQVKASLTEDIPSGTCIAKQVKGSATYTVFVESQANVKDYFLLAIRVQK